MSTSGLSEAALASRRRVEFDRRRLADQPLRVLVTGSHTFFGGRMIQALGQAGCEVTAADPVKLSCGKASRHTRRRLMVPPLRTNPEGFVRSLLEELAAHEYDLLLTTFEESILVSERRAEFEPLVPLLQPEPGVAWELHNKWRLHRYCREVGIRTPPTLLAEQPARWREIAGEFGFPAFVKPAVGFGSIGRSRCANVDEVLAGFECVSRTGLEVEPLLQKAIDGAVVSVLLFCHEGRILGELHYRSLRTFPDDAGISAHRESIVHEGVSATARTLVEASRWSGFLGLDIVVERGTDHCYLLDVNPRLTPALQLGFVAGVDWAHLVTEVALGRDPVPVLARPGLRARTVIFDIAWLLEGFCQKQHGLRTGMNRLRKYLRPGWTLDSSMDLVDRRDWKAKLAMFAYAISSLTNGYCCGCGMGDLFFRESTYDRRTAVPAEFAPLPTAPVEPDPAPARPRPVPLPAAVSSR